MKVCNTFGMEKLHVCRMKEFTVNEKIAREMTWNQRHVGFVVVSRYCTGVDEIHTLKQRQTNEILAKYKILQLRDKTIDEQPLKSRWGFSRAVSSLNVQVMS